LPLSRERSSTTAVFPDVHFHLARTLDELGRREQAERHWREFLDLAPDSPWAQEAERPGSPGPFIPELAVRLQATMGRRGADLSVARSRETSVFGFFPKVSRLRLLLLERRELERSRMATVILQLVAALGDASPDKRSEAAEQLCHLGAESRQARKCRSRRACADSSEEVREWRSRHWRSWGRRRPRTSPYWRPSSGTRTRVVGYWAATLLGRLGAKSAAGVTALAAALAEPYDSGRASTGPLGPWARSAPAAAAALEPLRAGCH